MNEESLCSGAKTASIEQPAWEAMELARARAATPHAQLIAELLDSRVPRTEREHAAAREIKQLRTALAFMRESATMSEESSRDRAKTATPCVIGDHMKLPPVLDACCGSRAMWFNKTDSRAIYIDHRSGTLTEIYGERKGIW